METFGNTVEEVELDFFHRDSGAESVDDGFAVLFWDEDGDAGGETLLRDEDDGEGVVFFEDAERFEIAIIV